VLDPALAFVKDGEAHPDLKDHKAFREKKVNQAMMANKDHKGREERQAHKTFYLACKFK